MALVLLSKTEYIIFATFSYLIFFFLFPIARTKDLTFKIGGKTGHGSLLLANTVGEKFQYIFNKMMELRRSQIQRMSLCPDLTLGDVTSVNLTKVNGGVQSNVIPAYLEASFDIRLSTMIDHESFENMVNKLLIQRN